jgi:hypothetical protein
VFSLLAFAGLMAVCGGALTTTGSPGSVATAQGVAIVGVALVGVALALAVFVVGIGVLQVRPWAWIAAVALVAVAMLVDAVALLQQLIARGALPRLPPALPARPCPPPLRAAVR